MCKRPLVLTLDGDDQLRDDWEHLSAALLEHVEDALDRQESVRVLLLADALKEDGEVVVVVELLDLDLPVDAVLGAVLDGDGEVAAVVEAAELARGDGAVVEGTGDGLLGSRLLLGLVEADGSSSEAFSLLKGSYALQIRYRKDLPMPLAATESSCWPVSPPMLAVVAAGGALTFFEGMCSGGKSPKGECFILGRSLLLLGLKGLLVFEVRSFLRWSSTIMVEA